MQITHTQIEPFEDLVARLPLLLKEGGVGEIPSFYPYIELRLASDKDIVNLAVLAQNPEIPLDSYSAYEFGNIGIFRNDPATVDWAKKNKNTPFAKGILGKPFKKTQTSKANSSKSTFCNNNLGTDNGFNAYPKVNAERDHLDLAIIRFKENANEGKNPSVKELFDSLANEITDKILSRLFVMATEELNDEADKIAFEFGLRAEFLTREETSVWARKKENQKHPFYLGLKKQFELTVANKKPVQASAMEKRKEEKLGNEIYDQNMQKICSKRAWNYLIRRAERREISLATINFGNAMDLAIDLNSFFNAYKGKDQTIKSLFDDFKENTVYQEIN